MPISKMQSDSFASGVGGKVLQVVLGKLTTAFTGTGVAGTFPDDNYFVSPGLEATITPQLSNSQILITTHVYVGMTSVNSGYQLEYQILKGGAILTAANGATTDGRLGVAGRANHYTAGNTTHRCFVLSGQHLDPNVATTSATKYEIRLRAYSGNPVVYVNRGETFQDGNNDYDGIPQSTITLTEIAV